MCNCGNECKCGGLCRKKAIKEKIDRLMADLSSTTNYNEFEKIRMQLAQELDELAALTD